MSVGMEGLPTLARSQMSACPVRPWEEASPTPVLMISNSRVLSLRGAKAGYFFERAPWVGLEADVYTLKPTVKAQTVLGGTSSGRVFADFIGPIPLQLTTVDFDIMIRSPSIAEVFQPYGGMGYGLFFATNSMDGLSNTNISPGFNLIAGARYALSPRWAFFGEFKFNRATIRFSDIRGNYDSQLFVFGLMWDSRDKY